MMPLPRLLALAMTATAGVGAEMPEVDIHGFASQGYIKSSSNNYLGNTKRGSAEFNEFAINVGTRPVESLYVGAQLLARDLGPYGNDKLTLDWAVADYRFTDWAGVRVGKFKVPLGLYNQSRDIELARTWVLLPQSIYPESYRDVFSTCTGVDLHGDVDLRKLGSVDYHGYAGTNNLSDDNSFGVLLEDLSTSAVEYHQTGIRCRSMYGGSLIWDTPLRGLRFGASGMIFDIRQNFDAIVHSPAAPGLALTFPSQLDWRMVARTLSAEYAAHGLTLAAEMMHFDVHMRNINDGPLTFNIPQTGWYVSAAYRFTERLEIGAFYESAEFNRSSNLPRDYKKDLALAVRYDINRHWLVKAECHYVRGEYNLLYKPNGTLDDLHFHDTWWWGAVKTTVSF